MNLKDFIESALEEYMVGFIEAELALYQEQQLICNQVLEKINKQESIKGVHLETLSQAVLGKAEKLEKWDPFVSETLLEYLEKLENN
jgi:hypothetical protein